MEKQKKIILSENLWKLMWKLSWPAIIAMLMFGLNLFFDAVFVGIFVGKTALAGVSIAYPLSSLAMGIGSLIGIGAGSILSMALGDNDKEKQKKILGNVNYLTIIFSVFYIIVGLLCAKYLVGMMGGKGEVLKLGTSYYSVTVLGGVFWIYGFASNMLIRAEGKMKTAALIMGIGLVVNILFNYLFVAVFKWGVQGVAWASNIGMVVYSILGILYFKSNKVSFKANPFSFGKNPEIIKSIFSLGMPSFIIVAMSLIQAVVVFNAISKNGNIFELAFYGGLFRIMHLLLMPIIGVMRALQPTVGINFGANQYQRVIKSFWIFIISSTCMVMPFWIISMFFPKLVLGTMLDTSMLNAAHILNFRIFMAIVPILPSTFMVMAFFPSIGKGKPASMLSLLRQIILYIPVMLILPSIYGIKWVYWGSTSIDILITITAMGFVLSELKGLKLKILKQEEKENSVLKEKPVLVS